MKFCWLIMFWNAGNGKIRSYLSSTSRSDHFDTKLDYASQKIKFADLAYSGMLEMTKFAWKYDLLMFPIAMIPYFPVLIENKNLLTHHVPGSWKIIFSFIFVIYYPVEVLWYPTRHILKKHFKKMKFLENWRLWNRP